MDYRSVRDLKDESIKDFIHETKVMKQVKDAGAKNINELIEAISIHSQLWLVCEYCPGGSVRTLVRPVSLLLSFGCHFLTLQCLDEGNW
jgi:serine/threonine protein kinase